MAFTGRDVAKFVTQITGDNYLGLYDEGEAQNNKMRTEAENKFKDMVNRMNEVNKRNQKDYID